MESQTRRSNVTFAIINIPCYTVRILVESADRTFLSTLNSSEEQFHDMSNKVYVGKLAAETTEKNLEEMFSKVGEIISIDISKKITFQPFAGSAYIVMKIDSDASKAVKELSNTELLGSRIIVTEAHTIDQKGHKYYYSKRRRR